MCSTWVNKKNLSYQAKFKEGGYSITKIVDILSESEF